MTLSELFDHLIDLRDLAAAEGFVMFASQLHCAAEQINATPDLFHVQGYAIGADAIAAYGRMVARRPWGVNTFPPAPESFCDARHPERGLICTLRAGHDGQHVAHKGADRAVAATWQRAAAEPNSTNDRWHRPGTSPESPA